MRRLVTKQLAFILAGQGIVLKELEDNEEVMSIMGNSHVCVNILLSSEHRITTYQNQKRFGSIVTHNVLFDLFVQLNNLYLSLAGELDVVEAKTPEDIYKSHLAEGPNTSRPRKMLRSAALLFLPLISYPSPLLVFIVVVLCSSFLLPLLFFSPSCSL